MRPHKSQARSTKVSFAEPWLTTPAPITKPRGHSLWTLWLSRSHQTNFSNAASVLTCPGVAKPCSAKIARPLLTSHALKHGRQKIKPSVPFVDTALIKIIIRIFKLLKFAELP